MSPTHSLAEIQSWATHWNSPTRPVRAREAKQATEQTCSLDVESAGPRATAPHFQPLSVSLPVCPSVWEKCNTHPLSRRHKAELKPGGRLTGSQALISLLQDGGGGWHPLRPCPRLQLEGGGVRSAFPTSCLWWRIRDTATGHLGQLPMFKPFVPDWIFLYLTHRHTGKHNSFLFAAWLLFVICVSFCVSSFLWGNNSLPCEN